jgi:hypothetical protein
VRAVYRIPIGVEAPGDARGVLATELCDRVPESVLDKLKLLVSEFVTNRIVSGRGCAAGPLILDLRADDVVGCAVLDHGPATLPSRCALGLLDQLADRWGLIRCDDVTQVWFETGVSAG